MDRRSRDARLKQLRAARAFVVNEPERFLQVHGGEAVGFGPKLKQGKPTGDLAIRLFVPIGAKKDKPLGRPVDLHMPLPDPESGDVIDFPTDVAESEPCVLHGPSPFDVLDVVPGGVSIGSTATAGGTLGGWAWDLVDDQVVLLSNSHVLGQVRKGEEIVIRQPASKRRRSLTNPRHLGRLLRADGLAQELVRTVDCAIASVSSIARAEFSVLKIGAAIMQLGSAQCQARVRKFAPETGQCFGQVTAPFWSGYVDEGFAAAGGTPRKILFRDCIKVESGARNWATHGDSGSLVFASSGATPGAGRSVLGLHFAGEKNTKKVGYACRIEHVCAALNITTLPHGAARLTISPEHRENAFLTMMELWRRLAVRGRADPIRVLLSEHRAAVTELVIRNAHVRKSAARLLEPFVGKGQGLADAAAVVIDEDVLESVVRFCEALRDATQNARITETSHDVVAWVKDRVGRTLSEVLGLGYVVETVDAPAVQKFPTARAALRAYLQMDDMQILSRYGAIGVRMGRGAEIVLEFEGPAPPSIPPVTFGGYTFEVRTETKSRPVQQS